MVMTEEQKKKPAYHEAGHCIVGYLMPEYAPVYKVTIIPRGQALGMAMFLPETDQHTNSKTELESWIAVAYGGRIAEEIIFGHEHTHNGAAQDIQMATNVARNMVTRWGWSDKMGPLAYSEPQGEVFLGKGGGGGGGKQISNNTVREIDEEIRAIADRNYERAEKCLRDNIDILHKMAEALMHYETIDRGQIDRLMRGEEPGEPADWGGDSESDSDMSGGLGAGDTDKADVDKTKPADDDSVDGEPSLN